MILDIFFPGNGNLRYLLKLLLGKAKEIYGIPVLHEKYYEGLRKIKVVQFLLKRNTY